jgi:O-6-methylguanine DNA methyltransferase
MNLVTTDFASRTTASANSHRTACDIEYAIGDSVLGKVLIARRHAGICAVLFGSNTEELERCLAAGFPDSRNACNEQRLGDDLSKVVQFIAAPSVEFDLDLDVHGTPFQHRVWNALRTIPLGKSLTYAQLACRVSGSKSLRAIAQACADNPVALAIPCHRVMGHSGSTAGYRWGIERKRALIQGEVAAVVARGRDLSDDCAFRFQDNKRSVTPCNQI